MAKNSCALVILCCVLRCPVDAFNKESHLYSYGLPSHLRSRTPKLPTPLSHRRPGSLLVISSGAAFSRTSLGAESSPEAPPTQVGAVNTVTTVSNVIRTQIVSIDGAEWRSYKRLNLFPSTKSSDETGQFAVVVWEEGPNRYLGWRSNPNSGPSSTSVYQESVSLIPQKLSTADALATMVQSLPIHALATRHRPIGLNGQTNGEKKNRSSSEATALSLESSYVVVWGSTPRAQQTATALSKLGAKVTLVTTTSSLKLPNVDVQPPAVPRDDLSNNGDDDDDDDDDNMLPICSALQTFDAMIDTIGDECELGVLTLLKSRHGCSTYLSTMSHSQEIIEKKGMLFGPGAAKNYLSQLLQATTGGKENNWLIPPPGLGGTVSALLNSGITLSVDGKLDGGMFASGWSLPAFWESTTWPRDTEGGGGRFGMPVIRDLLDYYDVMDDNDNFEEDSIKEIVAASSNDNFDDENPFVRTVVGVTGLQQRIMMPQEDCLLFLSAPFCRTCRYMGPSYSRMARLNQGKIVFAKADTTGLLGKELGRYLRVASVPTFVFFAKGRRIGKPLGITKLPSTKLQSKVDQLSMNGCLEENDDDDDDDDDVDE